MRMLYPRTEGKPRGLNRWRNAGNKTIRIPVHGNNCLDHIRELEPGDTMELDAGYTEASIKALCSALELVEADAVSGATLEAQRPLPPELSPEESKAEKSSDDGAAMMAGFVSMLKAAAAPKEPKPAPEPEPEQAAWEAPEVPAPVTEAVEPADEPVADAVPEPVAVEAQAELSEPSTDDADKPSPFRSSRRSRKSRRSTR